MKELSMAFYKNFNSRCQKYDLLPALETKAKSRFNFEAHLQELQEKTVLMFVNTNNAVDYPEPLQPNVIQVGGLQVVDPKPLPEVSHKIS